MPNAHNELYGFDKFHLDVSERILWADSERVPLSEKAFETLCSLVRRGNRLVGKDELLNEIWPDAIVEENNLDKNISILRQVLGERAGKGKFIETVRGHGFRFVPAVHRVDDAGTRRHLDGERSEPPPMVMSGLFSVGEPSDAPNRSEKRNQYEIGNLRSEIDNKQKSPIVDRRSSRLLSITLLSAVTVALMLLGFYSWSRDEKSAGAPIKTIAVLPFKSLVTENRDEALEMGVTDTLISKLSGGEEIIVRPLSSVRRYAAPEQDSLTAGRELDVETVLDGTIQTVDNRIRISAQLFRVSDGKQLWAGQFDEKFTDIFAVQNSISEQVATALKFGSVVERKSVRRRM